MLLFQYFPLRHRLQSTAFTVYLCFAHILYGSNHPTSLLLLVIFSIKKKKHAKAGLSNFHKEKKNISLLSLCRFIGSPKLVVRLWFTSIFEGRFMLLNILRKRIFFQKIDQSFLCFLLFLFPRVSLQYIFSPSTRNVLISLYYVPVPYPILFIQSQKKINITFRNIQKRFSILENTTLSILLLSDCYPTAHISYQLPYHGSIVNFR